MAPTPRLGDLHERPWVHRLDGSRRFTPAHRAVEDQLASARVDLAAPQALLTWQIAVAAVLEQRVTGAEARRAWRGLVRAHGQRAPGPRDDLWAPPGPSELLRVPSWDGRRYGVDRQRMATLRELAWASRVLDRAADLPRAEGGESLRVIPGVGVWAAAENSARASGDADSVSFGDYHLARSDVGADRGRRRGRRGHGQAAGTVRRPTWTSRMPRSPRT